ncbi:MAG: hypothetical protein GY786_17965 [Proteobacteria bacterium]|nr:hypothetical protein [Pseudomonadota bacterium]
MSMIQFSAQMGCSNSDKVIGPYHLLLNEIFYKDEKKIGYFKELDYLSIIFRVSGKVRDFDSEGPEFLKKVRGKSIYTIDFTISQENWQDKNDNELRKYINKGVETCFQLLKDKVHGKGEILDEEKLNNDFNEGMKIFLSATLPGRKTE